MKTENIEKNLFLWDTRKQISFEEAVGYEIHSHWLSFWIWGFRWGQHIMISYAIWKVKRKHKRYEWARSLSIW